MIGLENKSKRTIQRGDIYFADLNKGLGSEQRGTRPVVIIQNNTGNCFSPTVIVAAITGKINNKTILPTHCELSFTKNLKLQSTVLTEQISTLDKKRLKNFIGKLNSNDIDSLDKALSVSLGLL